MARWQWVGEVVSRGDAIALNCANLPTVSGTTEFPYLISPLEAIQRRAIIDKTLVSWSLNDFDYDLAVSTATGADVAMVFLNSDSGEEYINVDGNIGDRKNLTAWHAGDQLVLAVANVSSNVVVVYHQPGPVNMEAWIDHPNVTAVLLAGLPGKSQIPGLYRG